MRVAVGDTSVKPYIRQQLTRAIATLGTGAATHTGGNLSSARMQRVKRGERVLWKPHDCAAAQRTP